MLLLVFAIEYIAGELLFEAIDYHFFMLYFASVSFVDALVCQFLLKFTEGWRTKLYASLSVTSIFLHIIGAWMFQFEVDGLFYPYALWVVFVCKIILLDKAAKDAGDYIHNIAIRIFRSLVLRIADMGCAANKGSHQ